MACMGLDGEAEGYWFKPRYQQTMEGIPVVDTRITSELCPGALEQDTETPKMLP